MRRPLAIVAAAALAGVVVAAILARGGPTRHALTPIGHTVAPPRPGLLTGPSAQPAAGVATTRTLTVAQVDATATRWVAAMWARPSGQGPFDWLDQVAGITSPDLLAELRTARATAEDRLTIAVTVDIDGVYPSAVDPATVTVTCVAHRRRATGILDEPCATTVTVAAARDGHPVVTAVQ